MENEEIEKKESKLLKVLASLAWFSLIVVATSVITYFYTINVSLKSYMKSSDESYMTTKLNLINGKLKETFIYDMNEQKMVETALKGYVDGLNDPYTEYLTVDEMKSLMNYSAGTYVGVGVYLGNNTADNTIVVIGVVEGSEAQKCGFQGGDIITKINGVEYVGTQVDELIEAIKKAEGSTIKFEVKRNDEVLNFEAKSTVVKVKTVGGEMLEQQVAYIQIASFSEGTANEFINKYYELEKQNPKALVIDLRNNGGGVVEEALKIADYMVEKDNTLLITVNKDKKEKIDKSSKNPVITIPVVLLVNGKTASAAEILTGSLKDNCNYKVVGTNSYGKGVIQSVISFTDGSGLKITTDEYFTPNHNVINKVGISPDVEVYPDEKWAKYTNLPYEYDLQLQKAVEECSK